MNENEIAKACLQEASLSKAIKRKVGAVIVSKGEIIGRGHNHAPDREPCEVNGITRKEVVHAEISAITNVYYNDNTMDNAEIYITHPPCQACEKEIKGRGITKIHIVGNFLKFDKDKLRYDLIPPEVLETLAEVITYGAKKYKPNNWQNCDETDKYIAALIRHLQAHRMGELYDEESSMLHMAHVITNAVFLTYFTLKQEDKK